MEIARCANKVINQVRGAGALGQIHGYAREILRKSLKTRF